MNSTALRSRAALRAAIFALFALRAAGASGAPADAVRLTVAGDSLALGVGATDSSRGFAFDLFRRVLRIRPGSEATNLAIGGATAADVARLEVSRIADTQPDVVLLEVGANDLVRRHSVATFARDFRHLVAGVRRAAPRANLILCNVPDVSISPIFEAGSKPPLHRLALAYNLTVGNVAHDVRAPVVDLFAFSERARRDTARYLSADQFHPSDEGHAAIAASAWRIVRDALPPNR